MTNFELKKKPADFDAKNDWFHKTCSQVIQLEESALDIDNRLFSFGLTKEDIDEIIVFEKNMSRFNKSVLLDYDQTLRTQDKQPSMADLVDLKKPFLDDKLNANRKGRKSLYFKHKVKAFNA